MMPVILRSSLSGFSRRRLKQTVEAAMGRLGLGAAELSLCVVADREMIRANEKFFGRPTPTDVIAISQIEGERLPAPDFLVGDVIVSWDAARRQARRYGHSAFKELEILSLHGLLHTLGMEDETQRGRKAMADKVRRLLRDR